MQSRASVFELSQEARDFLIEKEAASDFAVAPVVPLNSTSKMHSPSILRGEFKGVDLVRINRDGDKLKFEPLNTKGDQAAAAAAAGTAPAADAT